jgi:hypothetical protein
MDSAATFWVQTIVGLDSPLGWCHAEKHNAPHHHPGTSFAQLNWSLSACAHSISAGPSPIGCRVPEKPFCSDARVSVWCSIRIMIFSPVSMKLSLHMDFAYSLLPPIRRGGIWKQIIKPIYNSVNLSSPNTRISI